MAQDELSQADPERYLVPAAVAGSEGDLVQRDYLVQVAVVEAVMLLTHRVGELARVVQQLERKL